MKAIVNNSFCQILHREKLPRKTVGKTIEVEFSADWEGLAITAVFEAGDVKKDVVYTGKPIIIPHEVLATEGLSVMLGFHGALPDGTIVKRTVPEWLNNVSASLDPSGETSSKPTPDWAAQVQTIALEAKEAADSVRSDAQAGKFNGSAGDDGGWYTPAVTQPDANILRVAFTPSKEDMPAVAETDITLPSGGGGGGSGEDSGYYTPAVTQPTENTMQVSFTPSKATMPAVSGKEITLPAGPAGSKGEKGDKGDKGADGKSAYQYAVEGGYTGTETEFAAKLAQEKFANPNALTFTGAVTGSYDGSAAVSVEIPSGGSGGEPTIIFDSGEIAEEVNLIGPIDISKYSRLRILGKAYPSENSTGKKAAQLYFGDSNHRLLCNAGTGKLFGTSGNPVSFLIYLNVGANALSAFSFAGFNAGSIFNDGSYAISSQATASDGGCLIYSTTYDLTKMYISAQDDLNTRPWGVGTRIMVIGDD